jgi:hypothetical protein
MVSTLNLNPIATTNAAGSFATLSDGFIQGMSMDDPAIRNALAGGLVSPLETLPMWGGIGIAALIPTPLSATTPDIALGPILRRANSLTGSLALGGFTVFDQNHSMIQTPQSPVPLALANMTQNFFRLGCGMRIPVACDPSLTSLYNSNELTQVSWDFVNQQLVAFEGTQVAITITGATWAAGVITFTASATEVLATGDYVTVSGVLPVGYNVSGDVTVVDGTHFTMVGPATTPGAYSSGGTIAAGGGALNVKVEIIKATNCKTVVYNSTTGFATWNNNGACALIIV